jgi:nicotinate-nucleotide adenylyltransferase
LARAALEQLALDTLYVIPTGQAWHKARELSAPEHRLAMARLAFGDIDGVTVDARELQRAGPTFTIDTLKALHAENPGCQLYLLIGADQFATFAQWHEWREILEIAIICIADRTESALTQTQFDAYAPHHHRFSILKLPLMPVSATQIRQMMASGETTAEEARKLVPEAVARYISLYHLYGPG